MRKTIVAKSRIREVLTYLIQRENNDGFNLFFGLNLDPDKSFTQKQQKSISIVWLFFLGICFAGCNYQIIDRVKYFLSDPMAVDVWNEVITERDVFKLKFCSQDIPNFFHQLQEKFKTKSMMENYLKNLNMTLHELWSIGNSTKWIDKAYFSMRGRKSLNATVNTIVTERGPCTRIYYGKSLAIDDPSLELNLKFSKSLATAYFASNVGKGSEQNNVGSVRYKLNSDIQTEIRITIEKRNVLSRNNEKCVTNEESFACKMKCQSDWINNRIKNCSVPFDRTAHNPNAPSCLISLEMIDIITTIHQRQKFEIYDKCNCPYSCEETMYKPSMNLAATGEIGIKLQLNIIRNLNERRIYSSISLFCDIGGSVSLFFGMSCLALVEIILRRIHWLNFKRRGKMFSKNILFKLTSRILEKDKRQRLPNITENYLRKPKIIIRLFYVFVSILCICQIYERIAHYFNYPISTTVEFLLAFDEIFQVISCFGSIEILKLQDEFSRKHNISLDKVDLLDLLDDSPLFKDANDLWRMSSNFKYHISLLKRVKTPFVTPFGNCTRHTSEAIAIVNGLPKCALTHFFVPLDRHLVKFKEHNIYQCNHIHLLHYIAKKIVRVNTLQNPCMSSNKDAEYCEQQCYRSELLKKNITCGLPFITSLDLPSCNTTKSAKRSKLAYLKAYTTTDPLKDCHCHQRCTEWVYWPNQSGVEYPMTGRNKHTRVYYISVSERYEVVIQILSFPIEKLLCDIGSNLGSIVGVSALSLFDLLHYGYRTIKM